MQKKIENDLISLAHSILQMKNKDDVTALHQKATVICEKLSVLKFLNHYMDTTLENEKTNVTIAEKKEEVEEVVEEMVVETAEIPTKEPEILEEVVSEKIEETPIKEETKSEVEIPKQEPVISKIVSEKKLIKIPLNDRILIVNELFEGNQGDFNRVLSQLNSFETEKEALQFIKKMVKPDYQWENFENTEMKLMKYISERFLA
ncbi:MAG: hypothetical protein KGV44_05385 [Flavobacteriaceae bacterium]|nr:hypothetical protein [Flavobacteriaceae bacterium]